MSMSMSMSMSVVVPVRAERSPDLCSPSRTRRAGCVSSCRTLRGNGVSASMRPRNEYSD